jgi:hypothetical protein
MATMLGVAWVPGVAVSNEVSEGSRATIAEETTRGFA